MGGGAKLVAAAVFCIASVAGGSGIAVAGAASAEDLEASPSAQLNATLHASDPLAPTLELANAGTDDCQIAATTLGTLTLSSVQQGGTEITPVSFSATFPESFPWSLRSRFDTLEPGETTELPLRVIPAGPTGQALEVVNWSATSISVGWLYPIEAGASLTLEGRYDVPASPAEGPPLCGAADTTAAGDRPDDAFPWLWLAGAAGALVVLFGGFVVVRRRRSRAVAGVAIAVVAIIASVTWAVRPADAVIGVHDGVAEAWAACQASFTMAGGDPANILPTLDGPAPPSLNIIPSGGDDTHHGDFGNGTHIIFWDPDPQGEYFGSGGDRDGCSSLYHEMFHAFDASEGTLNPEMCVTADGNSGIPTSEVEATRAQNQLREKLGLPPRSHYGDKPLPSGDCMPPADDPPCEGDGCANSHGDPHLRTFDGQYWSFMAVGEFVGARNPAGGFEVQTRQEPVPQSRQVSVNTAVAMDVAGDVVEIARAGDTGDARFELTLTVNGDLQELGPMDLPSGGGVDFVPGRFGTYGVVTWPDGSKATAKTIGRGGLSISVQPAAEQAGQLEGLFGDFDGDRQNDIRPAGGEPVRWTDFDAIYPELADSWRVDDETSLFTYAPGTGPQAYVDPGFPYENVDVEALPNREQAEALCRASGVSDPDLLATCTLDVAITGQPDFAAAAADSQAFVTPALEPVQDLPVGAELDADIGESVVLEVSEPGGSALVRFTADEGQRVFVDIPAATLPDACGAFRLETADGQILATGCAIDGLGFVDAVTLPAAGTYVVVLDPPRRDVGRATVEILGIADQREAIDPDGAAVTAVVDDPGVAAYFTFTGEAGQRIFVDVPSTSVADACSPLRLIAPDDAVLETGCLISGVGHIETTELPSDGDYAVAVDLDGRGTGTAEVRAYVTTGEEYAVTLGGGPATAAIRSPGDTATLTFAASANDTVSVLVSDATLPDDCGTIRLIGPGGAIVDDGCVINGGGGIAEDEGVTLPETGEYTVVVDPRDRDTGRLTVRIAPPE
jgi:hypothetical protein